ncbi:Exoglucanase B precursor [compost metagenome]
MNDNTTRTSTTSENTPSEPASTTSTNYSRWMTDMWDEIKDRRLSQLAIPGAHNSGVDMAGTWGLEELYGANQDNSFPEQLAAGARFLDLRLVDSSYRKPIGNHSPTYTFFEEFEFKHGAVSAGRRLQHLIRDVKKFVTENPQEIVILDFHTYDRGKKFSNTSLERCIPYFTPIEKFLIPASYRSSTLREMRNAYPDGSIILALNHNYPKPQGNNAEPDKWQPHWIKRTQIWSIFPHEWNSTDLSESGTLKLVQRTMQSPPQNQTWALSAAAYSATGPVHLHRDHPIRTKAFEAGYQNANIVMVDFIERFDTMLSVVDRCIVLNRQRFLDKSPPSTPTNLLVKAITVPAPGEYTLQNTLEFTWQRPSDNLGVYRYEVFRDDIFEFTTNTTTHRQKNLHLRNYTFKVRAFDIMGNQSNFSEPFQLIQDTTPPTIPENFRLAPPIGYRNVRVQWEDSFDIAGIEGYELRQNGQNVPITPHTSYTFSGLSTNEEHTLELRAKDINGLYSEYTKIVLQPRPKLIEPRVFVTEFNESGIYKARLTWEFSAPPQAPVYCDYKFRDSYITSTHIEGELPGVDFEARKNEQFEFKCRIGFLGIVIGEPDLSEEFVYALTFDPTPPNPVSGLKVTQRTESNISISWTQSSSQNTEYHAISFDEGPPTLLPASANSYNYLVVENKAHSIEVWAISDIGVPSTSEQLIIDPIDNIPPEQPGTPVVSEITETSAKLNWTASNDNIEVTGYTITTNNKPPISTTNTQHTLTELEEATQYAVEVRAFDAAGNLSEPSPVSFQTKDVTAPSKPGTPAITNISHTSATISWTPSTDNVAVTSYTITINNKLPISTTSTQYTLTELEEGTQYDVELHAFDAAGNSSPSASKSFRTKARPTPPRELSYSNLSSASVKLSWLAGSDDGWVVGYQVFRDGTSLRMVDSTTYDAYWLSPGRTYLFEVRTKDNDGYFSESARLQVTTPEASTPPGPVQNLKLNTTNAPTLLWRPPATGAAIQYIISKDDQHWSAIPGSPNPQCQIELPAAGENYLYEVRARSMADQFSEPVAIRIGFAPPHVLHLMDVTKTSFRLVWDAPPGAVGVIGYEITLDDLPPVLVANTQYTFTDLTPTRSYAIMVKTKIESGELSDPASLDVYLQGDEPNAPSNFRYSQPVLPTLEWDAPSQPVNVYRVILTSPGGTELNYNNIIESQLSTFLLPRTRYDVRITANNDAGESRPLIAEFTTL